MRKPTPQNRKNRISDTIALLLVSSSFVLAILDPNTRPAFGDLAKVVVVTYIGAKSSKEDNDNDR
jgi:hypothetical protein